MTSLPYTVLRVTSAGTIPLMARHVERLGFRSEHSLRQFAQTAPFGIYRVTWDGTTLSPIPRGPSKLFDGMSTRWCVSPYASRQGRFPKPMSPSGYDALRAEGVATLLTDAGHHELFESCSAAVVAWDGSSLVLVPQEVPAVASVAEQEIAAHCAHRRARILKGDGWPLLLVNAVVGTCAVTMDGHHPFPVELRAVIHRLLV
jgi:hypothetical protein